MSLCQEAADALAAPVQEPVGYVDVVDGEYVGVITGEVGWEEKLYTTPPAQPTPEQYTALEQALTRLQKRYGELEAKVAAQPAVPLTDEQIDAEFEVFASKFDHESNEWLDMGVDEYFRAGFRAAAPAARRQWVGLTDEELKDIELGCHKTLFGKIEAMQKVEAKLKEKNAAAQPAVPDAMTSADIQEHIEYVAGWNDCRAEMLKGMKP
jgi:hypothetical protein